MRNSLVLVSILITGCAANGGTGGDDSGSAMTSVAGQGVFRDASTDHQGRPQAAAKPAPQTANLDVIVEGQGTIPNVDPRCALDPAGQFQALFTGAATFDQSGAYVAALGQGSGTISTPSGCAVPDLTVGTITDVKLKLSLTANTENCQTYCAASARADAESQCGASADQASCRASAEASAAASCNTTCTTQAHSIVAEVSLGASAVGQVTASELQAAALGDLSANVTFDRTE